MLSTHLLAGSAIDKEIEASKLLTSHHIMKPKNPILWFLRQLRKNACGATMYMTRQTKLGYTPGSRSVGTPRKSSIGLVSPSITDSYSISIILKVLESRNLALVVFAKIRSFRTRHVWFRTRFVEKSSDFGLIPAGHTDINWYP